jgi:peptide-methionine (S)-S-oxide reductase
MHIRDHSNLIGGFQVIGVHIHVRTIYIVAEVIMHLRTFRNSILVGIVAAAALLAGCQRELRVNPTPARIAEPKRSQAIFAAGCFWGVEQTFRQVKGIRKTEVGFIGGTLANPTYRQVCKTKTGHAEAVRIEFEPSKVSYEYLLAVFWGCHNPTTLNRQGPDIGTQYRSAVFYVDDAQRKLAETSKAQMTRSGQYSKKIVTEITKAGKFYRAAEYHQQYHEKRGGGDCKTTKKKQ